METNEHIKKLIGTIGSILVGLFLVGCPALLACSIIYNLPFILFLISISGTLGELVYVIVMLVTMFF